MAIPRGLEDFMANPPVAPKLMPRLAALMSQNEDLPGPIQELVSEMGRRLMAARAEEQNTGKALQTAAAEPVAEMGGLAQSLMRSMGRAVGGLRGDESGPELAKSMIERENQNLLIRQKNNLAALADAHERAAKRAADLGDLDAELKSKLAIQSALDKQKQINDLLTLSAQSELEGQREMARLTKQHELGLEEINRQASLAERLEGIRQKGDERTAYINAGYDPDDPTKLLQGGKAQRYIISKTRGFLDTNQWTGAMARITSGVRKHRADGRVEYDARKMRARVLNELPPDASYFDNPAGWLDIMMNMKDPNNQTKFLFERGRDNVIKPGVSKQLHEYILRYWPDWNPDVAAVDSVGVEMRSAH